MAGMICKQPNGLYCRYSTIVEAVTHHNMTKEDYIKLCETRGISNWDATDTLDNYLKDYDYMVSLITDLNTTKEELEELLEKMNKEV